MLHVGLGLWQEGLFPIEKHLPAAGLVLLIQEVLSQVFTQGTPIPILSATHAVCVIVCLEEIPFGAARTCGELTKPTRHGFVLPVGGLAADVAIHV